ncbi:hypothetical protein Daesc_000850 [Daldinia eschscholtzii]|uniref:F-box domain-containing protein n=1 Tax=Daldinia eschscholtzii TaxID=292717 RepID=A0AAX6N075_9PEZI
METNLTSQFHHPNRIRDYHYKDGKNSKDNGNANGVGVEVNGNIGSSSSSSSSAKVKDLTDLPFDLFILISRYLAPQDIVLCRRVSRAWNVAFTDGRASYNFMTRHFPRSREMRLLSPSPSSSSSATTTGGGSGSGSDSGGGSANAPPDWPKVFAAVARRYFFLRSARPRLVQKIDVLGDGFLAVLPWNRWLKWNDHIAAFQHPNTTWTLGGDGDGDDGDRVLVYREVDSRRWVAHDLETDRRFEVPFDAQGKMVRRVRLAEGVLVFEWCDEKVPPDESDTMGMIHRHFATAYDVRRRPGEGGSLTDSDSGSVEIRGGCSWEITFRCEWDIHPLALPLVHCDRFYSAHTATHYAVYLWQPDRSHSVVEPFEQLTVWDISQACSYRPSLDPPGIVDKSTIPKVVGRFSRRDLEFLGVRQGYAPSLTEIRIDDANVYVHEEQHRWLAGHHVSLSQPRHHLVRCTGIPFSGTGPRWFDECCADGDVHMSFCPRAGSLARVLGNTNNTTTTTTRLTSSLWPGWAPCWRHEEFPYLTVSDAVDARAGVRIVARQCFMMEALSSFVAPRISVQEEQGQRQGQNNIISEVKGGEKDGDDDEEKKEEEKEKEEEDPVAEVRFADEMWWELMGRGKIAGDDRWVVGEDRDRRVTVVRF